jgi:hypothetical protein
MPFDQNSGKQSQMPASDPRLEERIAATEPVQLSSVDQPSIAESTHTQDISSHGARVITQRVWQPGSALLMKSLRTDFWARARVVYWRSFSSSRFAIGLEFLSQAGNWPTPH